MLQWVVCRDNVLAPLLKRDQLCVLALGPHVLHTTLFCETKKMYHLPNWVEDGI